METVDYYFQCECGNEIIAVSKYDGEDDIYLALFQHIHMQPGVWARIRYAWYVLWHAKYWNDQVVLDKRRAMDLSEKLKYLAESR